MWLLTMGGDLLNLDLAELLEVRGTGQDAALWACAGAREVEVAWGSRSEMEALLRLVAREIDADILGVLDVRTGRGAVP